MSISPTEFVEQLVMAEGVEMVEELEMLAGLETLEAIVVECVTVQQVSGSKRRDRDEVSEYSRLRS
jgi:hypothetical protein